MTDTQKLLPCPFCWSLPVISYNDEIACDGCGSNAPSIKAWNTRKHATPAPAEEAKEKDMYGWDGKVWRKLLRDDTRPYSWIMTDEVYSSEVAKAEAQPAVGGVDGRLIGCLIHDNLDLNRAKHLNVIAIYDAISPYLQPKPVDVPWIEVRRLAHRGFLSVVGSQTEKYPTTEETEAGATLDALDSFIKTTLDLQPKPSENLCNKK